MSVTLTIENMPDDLVDRLAARAATHHRSVRDEVFAILENACLEPKTMTVREVLDEVRKSGLRTPSEAAAYRVSPGTP